MRIKRTNKNYGGGSGITLFESSLFSVTIWTLQKGIKTALSCRLYFDKEIYFDGRQEFTTDELCLEQYTSKEILAIIKTQKELSFEQGEQAKIKSILQVLELEE